MTGKGCRNENERPLKKPKLLGPIASTTTTVYAAGVSGVWRGKRWRGRCGVGCRPATGAGRRASSGAGAAPDQGCGPLGAP